MSALHPNIRTLHALAAAFHGQVLKSDDDSDEVTVSEVSDDIRQCGYLAAMIRDACLSAATELENEQRELEARVISIPTVKGH